MIGYIIKHTTLGIGKVISIDEREKSAVVQFIEGQALDWARLASLLAGRGRFYEARDVAHRAQEICWARNVFGDGIDRSMKSLLDRLPSPDDAGWNSA